MNNGLGVLIHLNEQQAMNLIACINRAQITGAEAFEVAVLKQIIEQAIAGYRDRLAAPKPEPVEEGTDE